MNEPAERDDEPYPLEVDPARIMTVFRSFVLFDELYLHMQAMNIAVVDGFLLDIERDLLREYIEIERTPSQSCLFVSALSQMWIFAVYELVRTWRQRVRELMDIAKTKKTPKDIQTPNAPLNFNKRIRDKAIQRALNTPGYADTLQKHFEAMEPVFRGCEAIRITLAKHEVPKTKGMAPPSPGYARINMYCGAMDFEVVYKDGSFEFINRRDIAEAIRRINITALPKT
jgi:hypothetical protein